MARKALIMSCLLLGFVSFVVLAHHDNKVKFKIGVETGIALETKDSFRNNLLKYPTKLTLGGRLDDKYVKGEVSGSYHLGDPKDLYQLKINKAFAKMLFSGSEDEGMSFSFGKMSLGWGSGSFFREGDIFQTKDYSSLEKGREKSVWAFQLKQNFGSGLVGALAYSPDVEIKGKLANGIGAMFGKDFDKKSFVKDIRCGYAFLFDRFEMGHRAFILSDFNPWKGAELLLSVGTMFRHISDFNITVDLVQKILVNLFGKDRILSLNVGGRFVPMDRKYGAALGLELPFSDVISFEVANTHSFEKSAYTIGIDGELKFQLTREVCASVSEELKLPLSKAGGVESTLALKTKCKF